MSDLVVLATIAGRQVAVAAAGVQAVVDLEAIVPVPGAPRHVAGITALRSRPLTVIDMQTVVASGSCVRDESRALVVEHQGHGYALIVDEVADVVPLTGEPKPVPGKLSSTWQTLASALVETDSGPALLIDFRTILGANHEQAA